MIDSEKTLESVQGKVFPVSLITDISNETFSEMNLMASLTENFEPPQNPLGDVNSHQNEIEHDASIAVDFLPTQDVIPHIQDIDTPNISFDSASEPSQSSSSTAGGSDF